MNILEEIAAKTTERIRKEKEAIPLSTLRSAAEKRRTGAIDFDFPESKIILDEKGRPIEIKAYEHSAATRLIEDFMLLTNETIAEEYYWLELPFVYRIHETPDEEKLRTFATFLNNFGYSLHLTNDVAQQNIPIMHR